MKKIFLLLASLLSICVFSDRLDFSELVKKQSNSVVNIQATRKVYSNRSSMGSFPNDIFREFGFPLPEFEEPRRQPREATSSGSGFLIDNDGFLITNFHVVQDADEVIVRFLDRREFTAEIIGTDELSDIALLKISINNSSPVLIGNSDNVEQGDGVIAIGSPYNYDFSATFGIISSTNRGISSRAGIGDYVPYFQTDAAVNRGNSGGPLFNLDGEVIGINSQIYSRSGGNEGLAFAIPINVALEVVEQLKAKGKVSRGYLGVQGQEVSSDLAEALGMDKPIGALVSFVLEGESAEKAGIRPGDVIVEIDRKERVYFKDLQHTIGRTQPGSSVRAKIFRDGKYRNINVRVGELPVDEVEQIEEESPQKPTYPLGIRLGELDKDQADIEMPENGVRVLQVYFNSPAYGQLFRGDVITQIKYKGKTFKISKISDFSAALESFSKGDKIAVFGVRNSSNIIVSLTVE